MTKGAAMTDETALASSRVVAMSKRFLCGPLASAVVLVVARFGPVTALAAVILLVAQLAFLRNPARLQSASHDWYIVSEQVRRTETVSAPDLAFIGDSSCLMGIHVPTLRAAFPARRIESFCSIGYLGPASYAVLLDRMIERGATPRKLIVAIHPVQFVRDPSWEGWVALIRNKQLSIPVHIGFPKGGLDYLQTDWIESLIYNPLPGVFGRYYGGRNEFISDIRESHGSAVDPSAALSFPSLASFSQDLATHGPSPAGSQTSYAFNLEFEKALSELARTVARIGADRVYLIVTPVPGSTYGGTSDRDFVLARQQVAARLGLPVSNIIETHGSLSNPHFSSSTHLNRWGRILFTQQIAELLTLQRIETRM
jgi:hypothetical protein